MFECRVLDPGDAHHSCAIFSDAADQVGLSRRYGGIQRSSFRIAQEAMTNRVLHADAHTCLGNLWVDEGLNPEIDDDGRGVNGSRSSVGLTSMRERAEKVGGTVQASRGREEGREYERACPCPGTSDGN